MQTKKILLVQFRNKQLTEHEFKCIKSKILSKNIKLESFNAFTKAPTFKVLENYDALIFGGCGEFFVSKSNYTEQDKILSLIRKAADKNIPMLGLCFGFHLIGQALGGEVIHDPENKEIGSYKISLTKVGEKNLLFKNFPKIFLAQEGHKDHLKKLPPGAIKLASSRRCGNQAFQIAGQPIYATQFHPELSAKDIKTRLDFFKDIYVTKNNEYKQILKRTKDTPVSKKVIQNFVKTLF
ncbi:MAG: type 1 glutamine amidotransferase [Candidatus Uhrbacteria bacterium]